MWRELFGILVSGFVLIWALHLEFKRKGHETQATVARKVIYWVLWILMVVGNICFILQRIGNLLKM